MKNIEVSILGQEPNEVRELKSQLEPKIDFWHIDVVDGNFTGPKNIIKLETLEELELKKPIHLHLMAQHPDAMFNRYERIQNIQKVSYHAESAFFRNEVLITVVRFHERLRDLGIEVGIALNPETGFRDWIRMYDFTVVMGVNPGISGRPFIESTKAKIRDIVPYCEVAKCEIIVDGGLNDKVLADIHQDIGTGVFGSFLVNNPDNIAKVLEYKK